MQPVHTGRMPLSFGHSSNICWRKGALMWIPQRGEMVESELDSLIRRRDTHRRQTHQTHVGF
jgi:hypothetical protein